MYVKNVQGKFKRRTNKQVTDVYTEDLRIIVDEEARILASLAWNKNKHKVDFSWE